jgi:hypothetical protein
MLALNLDETNIIKCTTNKTLQYDLSIGYNEKHIQKSINTKFLGLQTENHLNWKNHIDLMIPKLSGECYAIRLMSHISSNDTLKSSLPISFRNNTWINFLG